MVKRVLITRPNHDIPTSYLHDFAKELVRTLKKSKDFHISDLEGPKANREMFCECVRDENPGFVFLNGHGNMETVAGHNDEVVLDKRNSELTKKRIIYALSCDSLEKLGKYCVKVGAKVYIGYRAKFMMVRDPSRESTPSKDKNAFPFKKACHTLLSSLIFGRSVKDSIETTKKEYRNSIRSYGSSEDDPFGDTPLIRFALAWNLEFLDFEGDSCAKID